MISSSCLFFSRLSLLEDKYEGWYPDANFNELEKLLTQANSKSSGFQKFIKEDSLLYRLLASRADHSEDMGVNCWHINENESAAMWKLYSSTNQGIAITSTFERLKASFDCFTADVVFIGKVKYIDYNKVSIPMGNAYEPYIHKRESFSHEKELRCLIDLTPYPTFFRQCKTTNQVIFYLPGEPGVNVPIDLTTLIEGIHLAPNTPEWIVTALKDLLIKYKLDKLVRVSNLYAVPTLK